MNAGSATLALTPVSQKKQEVARLPHAPMLARVAEAREYKEKSQLANVTSGEFILEPQKTDLGTYMKYLRFYAHKFLNRFITLIITFAITIFLQHLYGKRLRRRLKRKFYSSRGGSEG
jgi:hypothetical protein